MKQPKCVLTRRSSSGAVLAVMFATVLACAGGAAAQSTALDPLHTDGDKYHLVFENRLVRVLRYHDEPGAQTHSHHHPCFVLYALGPFERELTFPDGSRRHRSFQQGEASWMPGQSHAGHNVGETPTEALLIELKGPCG